MEGPVRAPGAPDHDAPRHLLVSVLAPPGGCKDGPEAPEGLDDPVTFHEFQREVECPRNFLAEVICLNGIRARQGHYEFDVLLDAWQQAVPPAGLLSAGEARQHLGQSCNLLELFPEPAYRFGRFNFYRLADVLAVRERLAEERRRATEAARAGRERISAATREEHRASAAAGAIPPTPKRAPPQPKAPKPMKPAVPAKRTRKRVTKAPATLCKPPMKVPLPDKAGCYSAPAAARLLEMALGSLYQAIHKGHIPVVRTADRRVVIQAESLASYRQNHPKRRPRPCSPSM